ncbi:MAG TPA: hypothetical protein VHE80_05265 [Acidimicrobiales bacterium]|nr:hypothetical protein [Acidimicrobiales bacterium]
MKPGDPFDTEATDELRTRQRRILREIPEWVVSRATDGRVPLDLTGQVGFFDTAIAEAVVREVVDEQLRESTELGAFVVALREHGKAEHASAVVSRRFEVERHLFQVTRQLLDRKNEAVVREIPGELIGPVFSVVSLLVLADELASDDYRDPRLAGES